PIRIEVKATPASYPQGPWLPSPQISISDRWSKPYSEWQVGEPVTRNITINAQGLSGSQLPSISLPIVEGVKYYPDQSEYTDKTDSLGIQGLLQQSLAIVPTKSGRIRIPEMRIPWWNITNNKLEFAILPAQTVIVAAGSEINIDSSQQIEKPMIPAIPLSSTSNQSGYWILTTLLLLFSNTITAFILWRRGNQPIKKELNVTAPSNKVLLKQVKKACQENDPELIRNCLKQWSQQEYQVSSLIQLSQKLNHVAFINILNELYIFLYQDRENSAYNGQLLWNNLTQAIKINIPNSATDQAEFSPLYQ
ncbi:MAG: BatD family protein, partial [Oleispira sp.]|nr:BatD family protein [Oleispira sp.]